MTGHTGKLLSKFQPLIFFLILVCEAIGTAATPGLLCQPRVIVKMIVEKQMECRLAGETEVLGENLSQRHLTSHFVAILYRKLLILFLLLLKRFNTLN
jgi:hypothetical protein